jgi:antitoxin component YwqK of YwqJK toxin-antitoxin module
MILKKGEQKKIRPNSKPKKTESTCKKKIHFEESEYDLSTNIDEKELYDDDVSNDGYYFADEFVCLICG